MSIESKIHTEDINIKDLSLNKPETGMDLTFDAEKEIGPDYWNKLEQEVNTIMPIQPELSANMAAALRIARPQKFNCSLTPKSWGHLLRTLESWKNPISVPPGSKTEIDWGKILDTLMDMKIVDPEKFKGEQTQSTVLDSATWNKFTERLAAYLANAKADLNVIYILGLCKAVKFLSPESLQALHLDGNTEIKKVLFDGLKNVQEYARSEDSDYGWRIYAQSASDFKILFPDSIGKIGITSEDRNGFKNTLEHFKSVNSPLNTCMMSEYLAILSAKEVSLTDDSIELGKAKFQGSQMSVLPEVKKF